MFDKDDDQIAGAKLQSLPDYSDPTVAGAKLVKQGRSTWSLTTTIDYENHST